MNLNLNLFKKNNKIEENTTDGLIGIDKQTDIYLVLFNVEQQNKIGNYFLSWLDFTIINKYCLRKNCSKRDKYCGLQ